MTREWKYHYTYQTTVASPCTYYRGAEIMGGPRSDLLGYQYIPVPSQEYPRAD